MGERILICTDLDRTLLPNGPQPESPHARERFHRLVAHDDIRLVYVSGRHLSLVREAIDEFKIPVPDFIVGDVGTSIYQMWPPGEWRIREDWHQELQSCWPAIGQAEIHACIGAQEGMVLQEAHKQNRFKVSYYVDLSDSGQQVEETSRKLLQQAAIPANVIWSIDELTDRGLLDILPANATKLHAIEFLIQREGYTLEQAVFSGDSGNDMEVFCSAVPSVVVANSSAEVQHQARNGARANGHEESLYIARGDFMGMNGNYSAGILEGIVHYHPHMADLLKDE